LINCLEAGDLMMWIMAGVPCLGYVEGNSTTPRRVNPHPSPTPIEVADWALCLDFIIPTFA